MNQKEKHKEALEKDEQSSRFRLIGSVGELRVFLSYARVDRELARKVRSVLSRCLNAHIFTPEMLSAGEDWEFKLKNELSRCDIFFIILSPSFVDSKWILHELGAAWALEKPIILVLTHRKILSKIPVALKDDVVAVTMEELEKPGTIDQIIKRFIQPATSHSSR